MTEKMVVDETTRRKDVTEIFETDKSVDASSPTRRARDATPKMFRVRPVRFRFYNYH